MKRFLGGGGEKESDSFELYIDSADLKYVSGKGYVVDLKDTPIVGASSVEITSVELPVTYYNVPVGMTFVTNFGTIDLMGGKYTSLQLTQYLDAELKKQNIGFSCSLDSKTKRIVIENSAGFTIVSVSNNTKLYNILGIDVVTGIIGGTWPATSFTFEYPSRDNIPLYFGITSSLSGIIAKSARLDGSSIIAIGDTSADGITSIPNSGLFGDINVYSDLYFNPLIFKNKIVITEFTIQLNLDINELNGQGWSCTVTFYF
jgi:hypothetical protein